jgi:hypothetical protein
LFKFDVRNAHFCLKRDHSVRRVAAGERAVVIVLFLKIANDDCIGIPVPDSPGALLAGLGSARFEDDNR